MSKWLHWTPSTGTKDEPTKPSKPTSEGFEGAKSVKIQKISPLAVSQSRKSKGQRGHNSCVFKNGACIFCGFEGKVPRESANGRWHRLTGMKCRGRHRRMSVISAHGGCERTQSRKPPDPTLLLRGQQAHSGAHIVSKLQGPRR